MAFMMLKRLLPVCALVLLLLGCGDPDKSQYAKPSMGELMSGDIEGFDKVVRGETLHFPNDHAAHPNFRQEWWYLTANLTTASGEAVGIQWTQFRVALKPKGKLSNASNQSWSSEQLWFAHGAVTSERGHRAVEKWSRGHPSLAFAGGNPFAVYLANWRWQSQGEALFPASLVVEDSSSTDALGYRLTLTSQAPLQLQGDRGYSAKSADEGLASYYYSAPFIDIEGEVLLDGRWQQVKGQGWLDREWSSAFLSLKQQGWDWFALRLSDGSALMLFQLREQQSAAFTHAKRMWPDGKSQSLDVKALTAQTYHQGYPVEWQITLADPSNPANELNFTLEAVNPDARMPLSMRYWEGPVRVSGSLSGVGYMELTGY